MTKQLKGLEVKKYLPYIDWPYNELKRQNIIHMTSVGYDYYEVLGIDKECVYSIHCGDPQGFYLFLLDDNITLTNDKTNEDEFEAVKEWWKENKDKYEQFIEKRRQTIKYSEKNGK